METGGEIYLNCVLWLAMYMFQDVQHHVPRSNGCVTQAAKLLALPPNQKGYRIDAFFLVGSSFLTGSAFVDMLATDSCAAAMLWLLRGDGIRPYGRTKLHELRDTIVDIPSDRGRGERATRLRRVGAMVELGVTR